jgi:hypothetical protein
MQPLHLFQVMASMPTADITPAIISVPFISIGAA